MAGIITRLLIAFCALGLASPALAQGATAGRRVALVIANSNYAAIDPLKNPVNDGKLVAEALKKVGFTVDLRDNLGLGQFLRALRDFRGQADGAEVALVYYAGHGVQADGENFLVPTDAEMGASPDLVFEGVGLDKLMMTLGGAKMRVAILDACRNDPFKAATSVTKAVTGLAQVEVDDVLLIFSAAPGKTAADGSGQHSPFATALASALPKPGVPLQMIGGVVRDEVIKATANGQRPFISASVTGTPFYLVPPATERGFTLTRAPASVARPTVAPTPRRLAKRAGAPPPSTGAARTFPPPPPPMLLPPPAPPPVPDDAWTAADPKLPMASVSVTRFTEGTRYRYVVMGTYPLTRRDGTAAPIARIIHFAPRQIVDGKAYPIREARRFRIGRWQPNTTFETEAVIDRALVDTTPGIELRLCIGGSDDIESSQRVSGGDFCFFSPNLIKDGPQRLINVEPRPRPLRRPVVLDMARDAAGV